VFRVRFDLDCALPELGFAVTPASIYSQNAPADQRQCASNALLK
jgi:hypothetical protein